MLQGRPKAARKSAARAVEIEPDHEKAREILEHASTDAALEGRALQLLTEIANEEGDYEEGIRKGKEAVKVSPESSNAHFQYAVALRTAFYAARKQYSSARVYISLDHLWTTRIRPLP